MISKNHYVLVLWAKVAAISKLANNNIRENRPNEAPGDVLKLAEVKQATYLMNVTGVMIGCLLTLAIFVNLFLIG